MRMGTVGWTRAGLASVLVLAGIGLAVVTVWAAGLRTGACTLYQPSGWIDVGLLVFAFALLMVVGLGTMWIYETPTVQRVFVAISLVEAAAAVVLVVYLFSSFTQAYDCG
jgi:hypothetical protein